MRKTALIVAALLMGCTSQTPTVDQTEVETLRAQNASLKRVSDSLRGEVTKLEKQVDRLQIDLEHAVNKKCVPSTSAKPKRVRIGVA